MKRRPLRRSAALLACALSALLGAPALAQSAPASTPSHAADDAATERGRQAYARGVGFAKDEQWGNALTAFEEAATARDAPVVHHNIAICERALGHYVAARQSIVRVLADPTGLAPSQVDEAKAYLSEFEHVLVHVKVHLDPPTAALSVDGRPLVPATDEPGALYAGLAPPGAGSPPPGPNFTVVLDPGAHLFQAVRAGHRDVTLQKSYRAGERADLDLQLDVLPATISLHAEPASSIVRIDDREVGLAPIEFERSAGKYNLEVVHDDFETYKATLDLAPGQRADMTARLTPYHQPLTKKWWFWASAAAVVVGGVAVTYVLTRPSPQPPAYDSGTANWLVQAKSFPW